MDTNGHRPYERDGDSPKGEQVNGNAIRSSSSHLRSSRNFDAINSVLNFDVDEFVDFWFRTSAGKIVIGQKPNTPMVVYSTAKTVASIAPKGRLRDGARLVADASLTYWAVLELTDGVNRLRKLMGFATLFGMLSSKLVKR
ncbi:hypothetical protein KF728_12555 [Candidatus Obscuribacterales bacterium]|nr:hypothetical protein [Candidatus Obscuribacterales bacterium]MBX3150973.1 hypothetical protein [Candidatus Obscuribacterales bacterium]